MMVSTTLLKLLGRIPSFALKIIIILYPISKIKYYSIRDSNQCIPMTILTHHVFSDESSFMANSILFLSFA
jgi:hypothetical protein